MLQHNTPLEMLEVRTMGRIVANARIKNLLDPEKTIQCDALVDLEQCQAAVDVLGLRLVHVKKTDLK
jgi:hypothetical protein